MIQKRFFFALCFLFFHQCYCFLPILAIARLGHSGQVRINDRAKLWEKLMFMRKMRENVKLDIVKTIAEQTLHCETSAQYKELEKKFLELLHTEDEIILEIERIVKGLTKKKIFSRHVCNLRPPHTNEA